MFGVNDPADMIDDQAIYQTRVMTPTRCRRGKKERTHENGVLKYLRKVNYTFFAGEAEEMFLPTQPNGTV